MPDNKTFQFALIVSILFHSVFFLSAPRMPFTPSEHSLEKIEITYYEIKKPDVKKESASKKSDPILSKLPDIKKEEILNPPKPIAKKPTEVKQPVKPVAEITEEKEKTFEKVVEEEKDDAKKAAYISYYKAVREKIRQHADRNYPARKRVGRGEIFISFVVASSGELLRVKIIDEKSVDDKTLRGIAMNSIREASPFPPFPKGMRQYQITFNIVISFELSN